MRVIHKFLLEGTRTTLKLLPTDEVLAIHEQKGLPYLWIDRFTGESSLLEERTFLTFATGEEIPPVDGVLTFVATFFLLNNSLVFHVFELNKPK